MKDFKEAIKEIKSTNEGKVADSILKEFNPRIENMKKLKRIKLVNEERDKIIKNVDERMKKMGDEF